MKRLNLVLQFFSKKGMLLLGIIIGIAMALCCAAHAEDLSGYGYPVSDGEGVVPCYFADRQEGSNTARQLWYIKFDANMWADRENLRYAVLPAPNAKTVFCNKSYTAVNVTYRSWVSDAPYQYQVGATGTTVLSYCPDSGYMIPYFSDYEKGLAYVNGTLYDGKLVDITECDNWSEIEKYMSDKYPMDKYELSYNSEIPYYDSCSLSVNEDKSGTYNAKMSAAQQSKTKVVTKDDKENETSPADDDYRTGYKAYAIYVDTGTFGAFNSMVTEVGIENMINAKKLDGLITFDASGRLVVKQLFSWSSSGSSVGSSSENTLFDQVSLSLLTPFESKDSDCPIVAVGIDSLNSKLVPSFQRTLTADKYLDVDTKETSNSSAAKHTHILIGYYATNIVYREDVEGNNECGNLSYSYQFIYDALRKRYGSGTNVMSNTGWNEGDPVLDPELSYGFDSDGNVFSGSDFSSGAGGLTTDNLLGFIKSGFGLLSNNGTVGFIALAATFFNSVPVYVWMLIYMAMAINIVVIVFKVLRGM